MMTDPIADMLTRIRNGVRVKRRTIEMPASALKVRLAEVLRAEGYIESYKVEPGRPASRLTLALKYGPDGEIVINSIERVSKPGRRVYSSFKDLRPVLRGLGIYALSTPKGVLSDRQARRDGVGGEILCKIH
jgi:small subunit ribosomal protein S8